MINNNTLLHGNGFEVSLWIGDSIVAGYTDSEGSGTNPIAGTTYQSDGTTITEVTADADFSTVVADQGSMMGQYAHSQYVRTGKKQVIIPRGVSGSDFVFENNSSHWGNGGDLYTPAKTAANNTLTLVNRNKLDRIIVCLGTNDAPGTQTLSVVLTGIDTFFDNLVADFPGVDILVIQPGSISTEGVTNMTRSYNIRWQIRANAIRLARVHIVASLYPLRPNGYIASGGVHPKPEGMNILGEQISRWTTLKRYTNKYVRGLLSHFLDPLSETRAAALQTFVTAEVTNGNLLEAVEVFGLWNQATARNISIDWTLLGGFFVNNNGTFVANDDISLNGTSGNVRCLFSPKININTGYNYENSLVALNITANNDVGTVDRAIGLNDGGSSTIALTQQAAAIAYQAYDGTGSVYNSETSLGVGWYGVVRSSSTDKSLEKNFTQVHSASVASSAPLDSFVNIAFGCMNNNGTLQQFLAIDIRSALIANPATFDRAAFFTNYNTLLSSW